MLEKLARVWAWLVAKLFSTIEASIVMSDAATTRSRSKEEEEEEDVRDWGAMNAAAYAADAVGDCMFKPLHWEFEMVSRDTWKGQVFCAAAGNL